MANKNIKVVNNMPAGRLGLEYSNGKKFVLPSQTAFTNIPTDEVWHIYNSCKTIQKGYLFIDDKAMRVELGLEDEEGTDINALSRTDLKEIVIDRPISEIKEILSSDLSDGTKEKIIILAREEYKEKGMDAKKVKLFEAELNMPIMESDGSDIKITNDIKVSKKVKKAQVDK